MSLFAIWFSLVHLISSMGAAKDSAALLILKEQAKDPFHTLQSWNSNSSTCSWKGIACSEDGDVVSLQLEFLTFESTSIPISIFQQLEELKELDMYMSRFPGGFSMHNNKLEKLRLVSNSFTNVAIHSCLKLKEVEISMNLLSEHSLNISDTCPSLRILNISGNNLSGSFPKSIATLPSLELLDASFNNFSGTIPMFRSTYLKHLDLNSNRFEAIASDFCAVSRGLTSLCLVNNLITEALHKIINCAHLEMLDISFNSLTLPNNLCSRVPQLIFLLAWANNLRGELPVNLAACLNLSIIILSHNKLVGKIPPELFQLQSLKWIGLSNNRLTGTIPSIDIDDLRVLQLSSNFLEGPLPEQLPLRSFELQNNKLSGTIPASWGNYAGTKVFTRLYLSSLRLAGLQHGMLAKEVCVGHYLALQGIKLETATKLLVSKTQGCQGIEVQYIPQFLTGNNSRSPSSIDIRYNMVEGNIPEGIGSMQDLLYLNLAHNRLAGGIPESFGMLTKLNYLNISHNGLSGNIPAGFSRLTFLNALDVSYNNLSGQIPQTGQLTTIESQNFEANPGLCGLPLSVRCSLVSTTWTTSSREYFPSHQIHNDVYIVALAFGTISFFVTITVFARYIA